jgi:hypothetical protein
MAARAEAAAAAPRPLQAAAIGVCAETGFWDALRRLKLDVLGTDDSPIPITGANPSSSSPTFAFVVLSSDVFFPPKTCRLERGTGSVRIPASPRLPPWNSDAVVVRRSDC